MGQYFVKFAMQLMLMSALRDKLPNMCYILKIISQCTFPTAVNKIKHREKNYVAGCPTRLRLLSFGMIQIRISDPRSLRSWCIKGTHESTLDKDPVVLLMHHGPSDLGSLILIWTPKGTHP